MLKENVGKEAQAKRPLKANGCLWEGFFVCKDTETSFKVAQVKENLF